MIEYIKREDALKTLIDAIHNDGFAAESEIERHELREDEIDDAINAIPAADVEPVVRGEWKDRCVNDWVCSLCGCEIQKIRYYDRYKYTSLPKFCPDCGAEMTEHGKERER